MAQPSLSATSASSTAHVNIGDSSPATSPVSYGSNDSEVLRAGALHTGAIDASISPDPGALGPLIFSPECQANRCGETLTNYEERTSITSPDISARISSLAMSSEEFNRASMSGTKRGECCCTAFSPSTAAPRLIVPSPSSSLEGPYYPQWSASSDCLEEYHASRGSTAASLSGGSGSPIYRPSGLPSFPQNTKGVSPAFIPHHLLKDSILALQALPESHMPPFFLEKHQEGGSSAQSPKSRQGQAVVGRRRDGSSSKAGLQSLNRQSVGCVSIRSHTGLSPTIPAGVPVSRHFDPLRASPFDLPKFDRRDPYVHFYIPVDCPFGRRCCDGLCPLAHTKLEKIFHPIVYRTQDRKEAELQWRVWEAKWASWRQHVDQLLLNHHKLDKEIRRKAEGILKIRMPRADAPGRQSGSSGIPVQGHEQPKAIAQQGIRAPRSFSNEARMAATWCSKGKGECFFSSSFANTVSPDTRTSARKTSNASSGPALDGAVTSIVIRQSHDASAVERNAAQLIENHLTTCLEMQQEWLYVSGPDENSILQSNTSSADSLKTLQARATSTLEETRSVVTASQQIHEALSTSGSEEQQGSGAPWRFATRFNEEGHSEKDLANGDVHYPSALASFCNISAFTYESGTSRDGLSVFGLEASPEALGEEETKTLTHSYSQPFCQPNPLDFLSTKAATNSFGCQRDFGSVEGKLAAQTRNSASKEHGNAVYPRPLNFFYCKQPQFTASFEGNAPFNKLASTEDPQMPSLTQDQDDAGELASGFQCPGGAGCVRSLKCWPPPGSDVQGHGSSRGKDQQSGGLLTNWCSPINGVSERATRRQSEHAMIPNNVCSTKSSGGIRRGTKAAVKRERSIMASVEDAGDGPCHFESPSNTVWQLQSGKLDDGLTTAVASPSSIFPLEVPTAAFIDGGGPGSANALLGRQKLATEVQSISMPEDDMCLLTRNLDHLLRDATGEVRNLGVMGLPRATADEPWQSNSQNSWPPLDLASRKATEPQQGSEASSA